MEYCIIYHILLNMIGTKQHKDKKYSKYELLLKKPAII